MWNTRPKMSSGEGTPAGAGAGTATPSRTPTWRQPSLGGVGVPGNTSYYQQQQQQQQQPQQQPDRREVEESMNFLSQYVSRQQQQQQQSLQLQHDQTNEMARNSPLPWNNRSASATSTGPPPSRLLQPKTNPNLQQWMAAREGSVGSNNPTLQQQAAPQFEAAPSYHNSHNAPPPPPTLSVPAGALSEPHQAATPLQHPMRRGISSPQTILQQTMVAQQMAASQQQSYQQYSGGRTLTAAPMFLADPSSPAPPAAAPPSHAFNHHAFNASTAPSPPKPLFRAGDHDGNLVLISTYLKNHYGRESEETSRGIETMEPEDVLGLVQCFYIDCYRLIRTLREQSSAGRGGFGRQDPSLSAIKPIVEAPQPQQPPNNQAAHVTSHQASVQGGTRSTSQASQGHDNNQLQIQQQPPTPPFQNQAPTPPPPPPFQQPIALQRQPTPEPQQHFQQQQQQHHPPASPFTAVQQQPQFPSYAATSDGQRSTSQQPIQQHQQQQQQQTHFNRIPQEEHPAQYSGSGSEGGAGQQRGASQQPPPHASRHARGPSNHRRELSLEQQLRDVPRRVAVTNVPLRAGMPALRSGAMMLKYCRSGPPHLRYFSVQDRTSMHNGVETPLPHLTWAPSINGSLSGQLSLLHLEEVLIGPVGPNAQRFVKNGLGVVVDHQKKPVNENLCYTLIFSDRTLELCATEEHDYETWVGTLQSIVLRNRELATAPAASGAGSGR